MNEHQYAVIMAGGIGSRFWPMSRQNYPKAIPRYFKYRPDPCPELPFKRLTDFILPENIYVVTSNEYMHIVKEQLPHDPQGKYSRRTFAQKYRALYCLYFF